MVKSEPATSRSLIPAAKDVGDAGEETLAADLAERFCRLTATHGFGENHNALTGKTHCDPACTWSAGVFQLLGYRYLHDAPGKPRDSAASRPVSQQNR